MIHRTSIELILTALEGQIAALGPEGYEEDRRLLEQALSRVQAVAFRAQPEWYRQSTLTEARKPK